MNRKTLFILLGLAVFLAYFGSQLYKRKGEAEQVARETLEGTVTPVAVTSAHMSDPTSTITLPGTIEAWYQAPIYAQVSGYVTNWYVDYGSVVKRGDILANIDTPQIEAQLAQAKADMEAKKAKLNIADIIAQRYDAMTPSQAVPAIQIAEKDADAKVTEAEFNAAKQNVENFEAAIVWKTIVAPYDGVIISRSINVGDYVNKEGDLGKGAGGASELFQVADVHKMRLFVSVPESFGELMRPGKTADVVVPQFPNRHFTANFLTVAKGFDPETRTVVTEFTIDNPNRELWPNSYATVRLSTTEDSPTTLVMPSSALVFDEKSTQVAVIQNGKVHFKPIVIGRIFDAAVEIIDGVTTSDVLINNPSAALLEGDAVRVVTPAPGIASNGS